MLNAETITDKFYNDGYVIVPLNDSTFLESVQEHAVAVFGCRNSS